MCCYFIITILRFINRYPYQPNTTKIKKDKPVIVCCASGMRSGAAKGVLQSNGFTQVYNAGSWHKLTKYVN